MTLPLILRVDEVMARYGVKDERTARRLMNEAGAFKVGGRLVVREDDLGAWERRRVNVVQASPAPTPPLVAVRRQRVPSASPSTGPDWWRA